MKILKLILNELIDIKKILQTIASSPEQKKTSTEVKHSINYFNDDPEAIAVIKNKDASRIIQEIIDTETKVTKLELRLNSQLK